MLVREWRLDARRDTTDIRRRACFQGCASIFHLYLRLCRCADGQSNQRHPPESTTCQSEPIDTVNMPDIQDAAHISTQRFTLIMSPTRMIPLPFGTQLTPKHPFPLLFPSSATKLRLLITTLSGAAAERSISDVSGLIFGICAALDDWRVNARCVDEPRSGPCVRQH
jgi:hypothetical protein